MVGMGNIPQRHPSLNPWFPVAGAVWGSHGTLRCCGLPGGHMSLLWALRVYNLAQLLIYVFYLVSAAEDTVSQLPAHDDG